MSPTAECAAHTLSINLKANASFPAGRVSLVIAGQSPVVGRQEVLVVRISVPDRGDVAATTIEYDDGTFYAAQPRVTGTRFCKNAKGTGFNAGGRYFGDAARGNCLGQMRVKDY